MKVKIREIPKETGLWSAEFDGSHISGGLRTIIHNSKNNHKKIAYSVTD